MTFDDLEKANHDLTHVGMVWAGTHLYYCENCGMIWLFKGFESVLSHASRRSALTSDGRCAAEGPEDAESLKDKIEALMQKDRDSVGRDPPGVA